MKTFWIAGRFVVGSVVALGIIASLGWYPAPLSSFHQEIAQSKPVGQDVEDDELTPETLVADWDKPTATLFITGRQHGYIEPCGCITLERQKGGLMRRHRVQTTLKKRGWDLVSIDAGNQVRRSYAIQPQMKFATTADALVKEMNYSMIGLGPDDLKLEALELAQKISDVCGDKNPFTCANVQVLAEDFTSQYVVVEQGGLKIGMTMVLGNEYQPMFKNISSDDMVFTPAEPALQKVAAKLQAAQCDFHVLVAFAGLKECRTLAQKFPLFDLMVTAGGAGDPTMQPELINTAVGKQVPMVQVGVKGMYVGLIGIFKNEQGGLKIRYKRVPLTHRFEDTEPMKKVFLKYQNELKDRWLSGSFADIKPREHPTGYQFVGSDACADCHDEEYAIWEDGVDGDGGPHVEATESLKQNPNDDRVWVQRHYDPECMSCHATGWNPQNFYPYKTGLTDLKTQQHLFGNGCENCHGPGSAHVQMERTAAKQQVDETMLAKLRSEMVVTLEQARNNACKECHDLDNSPDFLAEGGFDEYWPQIEHGGN